MIANVQGNARSKIWTPLSFHNFVITSRLVFLPPAWKRLSFDSGWAK